MNPYEAAKLDQKPAKKQLPFDTYAYFGLTCSLAWVGHMVIEFDRNVPNIGLLVIEGWFLLISFVVMLGTFLINGSRREQANQASVCIHAIRRSHSVQRSGHISRIRFHEGSW